MKTRSSTRLKLLAAATVAIGTIVVLPRAGHGQTVTYILSINDDGHGDTGAAAAGDYAVYAEESGAGTYGFDGIGVDIGGLNDPSDFLENDLPIGTATPGSTNTAKNARAVTVGFSEAYYATYPLGGAQDTPDVASSFYAGKPPAAFLTYGVGQVSGSESAAAATIGGPGSTFTPSPIGTGTDSFGVYLGPPIVPVTGGGASNLAAILVADGTFAPGETPAFLPNNNSALLFVENGQANFNPNGGDTESIQEGGITFLTYSNPIPQPPPPPPSGVDDAPFFGAADKSDVVTVGPGNGNYIPLKAVLTTPNNKGYFEYGGFTPGDTIDIAIKFTSGGSAISASEIASLIAYINGNDTGSSPTGVSAYSSAPAAVQAALGNGAYDILFTSIAGANEAFFDYDFTGFTSDPSLEVTGIGIVPEPAELGLLGMICLGFFNRRWHNRAITLPNRGH